MRKGNVPSTGNHVLFMCFVHLEINQTTVHNFTCPQLDLKVQGCHYNFKLPGFCSYRDGRKLKQLGWSLLSVIFLLFPLKVTWGLAHSSQGRPRTRAFVKIKIYLVVIKASLILDKIRLNIPFNFAITWPFHLFQWAPFGSGTWQNVLDINSWVLDNQI